MSYCIKMLTPEGQVKVMISTKIRFLSRQYKYYIVFMTFKAIQGQRSWYQIKETTQVHIYEELQ